MPYTEDSLLFKGITPQDNEQVFIAPLKQKITKRSFVSGGYYNLPGVDKNIIRCGLDDSRNGDFEGFRFNNPALNEIFDIPDTCLPENSRFNYMLLQGQEETVSDRVILLFHGLNEKAWDKYLVWGSTLQRLTGCAVLFFPITFHMNRTPAAWSNSRLMNLVSQEKKALFPQLECSSFANAAISMRLLLKPQRFFFSGFQTYYDIMRLIRQIRSGSEPGISASAHFDIFSYSIGAFLSEILLFSNTCGYLEDSKLCIFCGGSTTDGFQPVTKTIMDSMTFEVFSGFYAGNFDEEICRNRIMRKFYEHPLPEALYFQSLMNYDRHREFREKRIRQCADRILAIPLGQDSVIPPEAVQKTLTGRENNIPVSVETMDFPYKYTHEVPFPVSAKLSAEVDHSFDSVFETAAGFFV